jgi:outer membrane immunogenic protein
MTSRLIRSAFAATALIATSLPALAADIPRKAAPYVLPAYYNWTGLYVGMVAGYATGSSQHLSAIGPITDPYDMSGMMIGGTVGYNWQFSNWVIGVEGDWSWTNKKGSAPDVPPFNVLFTSATNEKWIATVRGRLGYAFAGDWLIYGTAGLAVAAIEATVIGPTASAAETKTRMGWTFGAGVEKALWGSWSIKGEYLYVKFRDSSYFDTPPLGIATRSNVPVTDHLLRVGLNYKFSGPIMRRF